MINLNNIALQLGNKLLLQDVTFTIFDGQKVGLVGVNGSGKSSLFGLLLGEHTPDHGELGLPRDLVIGHLAQQVPTSDELAIEYVIDGDKSFRAVQQALCDAELNGDDYKIAECHTKLADIDGYTVHARAGSILNGLGFIGNQHSNPVNSFSGGWRVRLNLAQTLMSRADLLLLDEPTNHLDLEAILWLEKWLQKYQGTLLLISHDREFLDNTINRILHIENQTIASYSGNYSSYEKVRAEQLALQQAMHEKQQKQIKHMMKYVDRFRYKASKARQAQSRLKAINKLESISAAHVDSPFQFEFPEAAACPNPVLRMENLSIGYNDKPVLTNINQSILPGSRIGLLGPNGAGKSTLVKVLAGFLQPISGTMELGRNLQVGYFAQHQLEYLRVDESPLAHLQALDRAASEQKIRNYLGGFNFYGDMATNSIQHFSGGEKSRLALALLVYQKPNLLLLDEPTNHLDIDMRNALSLALQYYNGVMILISHDRHLLQSAVDEFWLVANASVQRFDGDLKDYQTWVANYEPTELKQVKPTGKNSYMASKKRRQLEAKIAKLENELAVLQQKITDADSHLAACYADNDKAKIASALQGKTKLTEKFNRIEAEWLVLCNETS